MKPKVLILEDEIIISNAIKMHLDANGYQCEMAFNPEEAKDILDTDHFVAMVCDINLKSNMSGIEFVQKYIQDSIPVIFLTAYNDYETMNAAALTTPYAYITKPFDKNHLLISLNLAIINHKKRFIHHLSNDLDLEGIDLSCREKEIIKLISESKTNDEMATLLSISAQTIATHRKNILKKTGAKSIIELISISIEKGWI